MQDKNYITIQAWMRTELDLKGNELLIYAIIYGFCQDGMSTFSGSLQYLADWCGCTRQGALKNLKSLVDKGFIQKTEINKSGVKLCEYLVVYGVKHSLTGVKHSLTNNTDNTDIDTHIQKKGKRNIDNRKIEQATGKKLVTKNLYTQCKSTVSLFKFTGELQDKILEYLSLRLKMSDKPIYSASQWKAILVKLTKELAPDDPKQQLAIVNQSIERGYASFFPVSDYKKSSSHRRVDKGVSCDQYTEEEKKEIKKWQDEVVKHGGRIKF